MDVILSSVRRQFALLYLDDTVSFWESPKKQIGRVRKVLTLLRDAGVITGPKECKLFPMKIHYLGYVNRPRRFEVSFYKTDGSHVLKAPSYLTNLRYFLGLCNVFRQFIPNFAHLATSLNRRVKIY